MAENKLAPDKWRSLVIRAAKENGMSAEESERIAERLATLREMRRRQMPEDAAQADDIIHMLIGGAPVSEKDYAFGLEHGTPRQKHMLESLIYDNNAPLKRRGMK